MAIVIDGSSAAGTINLGSNGTITNLAVGGVPDNTIDNGCMADDSVGIADLSATGTASSSTYLRGDNSWAAVAGGVSSDATQNTVAGTNAGEDLTSSANANTIYGYDAGKQIDNSDHNVIIGAYAFTKSDDDSASNNTIVGNYAGWDITTSLQNTLVGYGCGYKMTTGGYNSSLGMYNLYGNGSDDVTGTSNTTAGHSAMYKATSASDNVAIGGAALYSMTTGTHNVAVGRIAGYTNIEGHRNTFIGYEAGKESTSNDSVYVGRQAGISVSTGTGQVMIGDNAGKGCQTGSYNVCLGLQAGKDQISAAHSHRLWIARSDTPAGNGATWIYGSDGGACTQGNNSSSWTTTSDQRLKKDITDNTVGLSVIENVKVRNYKYKQYIKTPEQLYDINDTEVQNGTKTTDDIKVARSFAPVSSDDVVDISEFPKAEGDVGKVLLGQGNTALQLGVVAQELESVAPNCVITDDKGVKSVDTDELFWHMLNAIKELSTKVKALEAG